jgi:hypothetical protein
VPQCPVTGCDVCSPAAINRLDAYNYQTSFSRALESVSPALACGCVQAILALCIDGTCEARPPGPGDPPPSHTMPACASVGGHCIYSVIGRCPGKQSSGPADTCLQDNEVCCLL